MIRDPQDIEARSMQIIRSELKVPLPDEVMPIVMRVIHATADFSFAESMYFSPNAVRIMRDMLSRGATIITDTNMALAGINKMAAARLGAELLCEMADEDVARAARDKGVTRASVCAARALEREGKRLLVCGNAPTFLLSIVEALKGKAHDDIAVIGVPVGFVNVVESKEALRASGLTCIASMGRRGGSNVAAAIVNALMYGIGGVRE